MSKKGKEEQGFTLIEILIVVVILSILAWQLAPRIMGKPEEAKRVRAQMDIATLETTLKMFKLDNGFYPSTEQGLQALVEPPTIGRAALKWREGGYLEKGRVPKDPWDFDYIYLCPGVYSDFDLSSYGADGEPGGEGADKDINNWEIE
jgi:general secretion pathway protein G